VRRLPGRAGAITGTKRAFFSAGAIDLVDGILAIMLLLPLPRAAAALASADRWLGTVLRDTAAVSQ